MEKRTLLAVALSIGVFYLFSYVSGFNAKPVQPTKPAAPAPVSVSGQVTPAPVAMPTPTQLADAQDVVVETGRYRAVFSTAGAGLKQVTLKGYRTAAGAASPDMTLLVPHDPAETAFSTRGAGFNLSSQSVYKADAAKLVLAGGEKKTLTFTYVDAQGFVVKKTYGFDGSGFGITLTTQLVNNGSVPISGSFQHLLTGPGTVDAKDRRYETYGFSLFAEDALKKEVPKDLASASKRYDKQIRWVGLNDKYFLGALLAVQNSIASVELKKNANGFLEAAIATPVFTVAPGQTGTTQHKLFVGPKEIDTLKLQGESLEQSLDLGWFSMIAKPMLYSLKFFYNYVGNYGIAIIIITVILKIFFFPLTHKSYKSMKEMSNLQPKMAALKEKHKNNKDALNKAVMELYRDHKVNPLGGCLPMLVQIPVFFALYKALMYSIELRHAPFMMWITDLSDKDPYYVTPLIMGVTMFVQQKMTPSNMDEMQQKIMLALPVVFTFMFLSFPSGLVLYWLVNNILTIGQQAYINKLVNK